MKRLMFAGLALALAAGIAPAGITIDDFAAPAGDNTIFNIKPAVAGPYTASQGPGLAGVLGGRRDYELNITGVNPPNSVVVTQYAVGGASHLVDDNGSAVVSSLELIYGKVAALNANLSNEASLTIQVITTDHPGSVTITLTDGAANTATVTVAVPAIAAPGAPITVLMSAFAGVNLSDIDKIQIKFSDPEAWDFRLDSIFTTSKPPPPPVCGSETAWAAGLRYVARGNWAMYVPYDNAQKTVNIIAGGGNGHGTVVGTATFSAPVNGHITIGILLVNGAVFANTGENLKIQDYAVAPTTTPSPGRFAWKTSVAAGSTASIVTVPVNKFYGVHLEVAGS